MPDWLHSMQFWSKFIFWFVAVNTVVSAAFVVVVMIGGLFDLRYLLSALREHPPDETDDGRVEATLFESTDLPGATAPGRPHEAEREERARV